MNEHKENGYFNRALSDFVQDFANGDEIRHLADCGLSVSEIKKRLSFPASKEKIGKTIWEHFVRCGRICLKKPDSCGKTEKTSVIKETDAFGRISFRQVKEELPSSGKEYMCCNFGRYLVTKRPAFMNALESLSEGDREYVLYLPWPAEAVWHEKDDRIKRILAVTEKL